MKKIFIILLITASISAKAQDTTIAQLSTKARLVQTLAPFVHNNEDTAFLNLFKRWLKAYDVPSPPSGTTLVVTDSIKVVVIAACYAKAMSYPQGALAVGSDFQTDVATIRAANTYLDRLLDAIDLSFSNVVSDARTYGRKILTAKNQ